MNQLQTSGLINKIKPEAIRLCSVIIGNTLDEFLDNLEYCQSKTKWVELRVDYIKGLKLENIIKIKEKLRVKSIFTYRTQKDGGMAGDNLKFQKEIYKTADDQNFDYIDIDYSNLDQILGAKTRVLETPVIASFHDYIGVWTPSGLQEIVQKMQLFEPAIYKFALQSDSHKRNLSIYDFINQNTDKTMLVVGMGEEAKETRLVAPLIGSFLTFVTVRGSSAPGQISLEEATEFYKKLQENT